MRVLIVDDDPFVLNDIWKQMQDSGLHVLAARTISEAQALVCEHHASIGCAIIDARLPLETGQNPFAAQQGYTSGLEFARWLVSNYPGIPFVGYSLSMDQGVPEYFRAHGSGFFRKGNVGLRSLIRAITRQMPAVFLSHSTQDKEVARRIGACLSRRGARVWIDEGEVLPGRPLLHQLMEAIDDCDYLVVLVSRHSCASSWVMNEIGLAIGREQRGDLKGVIPILIDNCQLPGVLAGRAYADMVDPDAFDVQIERIWSLIHPAAC